jgi:hypothetical protein
MNKLVFFTTIFIINLNFSQEIDCKVIVNSVNINQTNKSIFSNLEKSIYNLTNNNSWSSNNSYLNHEKIDMNLIITVNSYSNNNFVANFEFQSLRPVLNSTYQTPVFNFVDKNVEFNYEEYESLLFNETYFQSDIVSLVAFYINLIFGLDQDTFSKSSGSPYYNKAQQILNLASQSGTSSTWNSNNLSGRVNKFWLIENLNSSNSKEFRDLLYTYHVDGLDLMHKDRMIAKKNILKSILSLNRMNRRIPNSILIKTFFETKSDEIVEIFSGGPEISTENLLNELNKLAPFFSNKWNNIR